MSRRQRHVPGPATWAHQREALTLCRTLAELEKSGQGDKSYAHAARERLLMLSICPACWGQWPEPFAERTHLPGYVCPHCQWERPQP